MKCRFFLFFVSLLFLATPQERLHAPSTPITSITVDPGLTQEQLDAMGTVARDARLAIARESANRALAGTDVVTAADAATRAKAFYDAKQAEITALQALRQAEITTLTNQKAELDDDKKDAEDELKDNTIGLSMGMVGVAGAAGLGAWVYKKKNNRVSRKNALRKAKHAREIIEKMADQHAADQEDPRKATKLRDALDAIMKEEQQAVSGALERTKGMDVDRYEALVADIGEKTETHTHAKAHNLHTAWEPIARQKNPSTPHLYRPKRPGTFVTRPLPRSY